jgi:5-hydroxyisourate hydrolase-like protein (transthyretin family)
MRTIRLPPPIGGIPIAASALAIAAAVVDAQSVRGRVLDAASDTPIRGAAVALVDADGGVVGATQTDDEGRFVVDGAPVGSYELRLEALGYEATGGERVEVGAGPVLIRVLVEPAPVETEGIVVRVQRQPSHLRARRQVISGKVLDARSDDPVSAMSVVVRDVDEEKVGQTLTDEDGRFFVIVEDPGLYHLSVARMGYDDDAAAGVAVSPGQDLYLELRVQPRAFGMEPITVTAPRVLPYLEANGFYDRMKRGHGSFIGPRDMDRFPASFPTQLLRRIPGVSVTPRGRVAMRGAGSLGGPGCTPRIILDGMGISGGSIDDLVPLAFIDAMEVYRGAATVPPRWRSHATCGVIVIWTKH